MTAVTLVALVILWGDENNNNKEDEEERDNERKSEGRKKEPGSRRRPSIRRGQKHQNIGNVLRSVSRFSVLLFFSNYISREESACASSWVSPCMSAKQVFHFPFSSFLFFCLWVKKSAAMNFFLKIKVSIDFIRLSFSVCLSACQSIGWFDSMLKERRNEWKTDDVEKTRSSFYIVDVSHVIISTRTAFDI